MEVKGWVEVMEKKRTSLIIYIAVSVSDILHPRGLAVNKNIPPDTIKEAIQQHFLFHRVQENMFNYVSELYSHRKLGWKGPQLIIRIMLTSHTLNIPGRHR